jgi:glucose-1-phosphate cytidylyltransferase
MTYGDGLGSVDVSASIKFHQEHGRLATMTAVQPPGRFGALDISGTSIKSFLEKPQGDGGWVNGGFFVLNPKVIDLIDSDETIWERKPLENLAQNDQLQSFFPYWFLASHGYTKG